MSPTDALVGELGGIFGGIEGFARTLVYFAKVVGYSLVVITGCQILRVIRKD